MSSLSYGAHGAEAQCTKAFSYCEWKHIVFQNCKFVGSSYRKEEVNHFFDAIGSGLAINKLTESLTLRNISGKSIDFPGDVLRK